jgi:6-phosphogluconolactonase
MISIETFPDRETLAAAAAQAIADALSRPGPVSFVATGGSTPGPVYDRLSHSDLDWRRVTVTLGDDRWVDPASSDSNERLVRTRLLSGHAAGARFLPLKGRGDSPDADAAAVEPAIGALLPFAVVLLGMGEDGHIASLFPRAPAPAPGRLCMGVAMSGLAPFVPRITLTLEALLRTRLVILLITGEAKLALVNRAITDRAFNPPAAGVLRQDAAPVRVLWAL